MEANDLMPTAEESAKDSTIVIDDSHVWKNEAEKLPEVCLYHYGK